MSRATFVLIDGELIQKTRDGEYTKEYLNKRALQATDPFHGYGSDTMPGGVNGTLNHADGKRYDSKSEYHKAVKAKGCVVVGNDLNNKQFKREIRGDFNVRPQFKEAVQKAFQQG